MICIICGFKKKLSEEHIFPESIGGNLTINNICIDCNNKMGRTIDCYLVDNPLVLKRMLNLQIKGKKNKIKTDFYNNALESSDGVKYKYSFDENGIPDRIIHPFVRNVTKVTDDLNEVEILADISDKKKILDSVNGQKKKLGHELITVKELLNEMQIVEIKKPSFKLKFSMDLEKLSIALYKIAYELAFLWLGEKYFNDRWSIKIRKIIDELSHYRYRLFFGL